MNYYRMKVDFREQVVLFLVMFVVAICFNPMNMLAFRLSDLYISTTLVLSSLYMASTMVWAHEVFHYFYRGHFRTIVFWVGVFLSAVCVMLLRTQLFVSPRQWLRRMIPHHSTALTTTTQLLKNNKVDNQTYRLAKDIVITQQMEIDAMKLLL